ncbi:MAG: phenylalanine--tRNA ligase subunit beta [Opitutaceae bacterium]|nr:phenylalanine--tRNA ligase subunit beta [Opitutaceae bacterium]
MKVSYNWLKKYIPLTQSPEEIEGVFTLLGFEVESVESKGLPVLDGVVVGEVLERNQHPNADRLSVCRVGVGEGKEDKVIVCGAQNYKVGDRVPVALPGAVLPGGFTIKSSKLRGVQSDGMMCSGKEIGYGEDGAGLLLLAGDPLLGAAINDVFPDDDYVFDLEVTPNRPDCLSHIGLARELAAAFNIELKFPSVQFSGVAEGASSADDCLKSVVIESKEQCPLYVAHVISGVKIAPSPEWLQTALTAVGLRPINNVVDVTNYVLMELGQPMHAFDAAKIAGHKIVIRQAAEGEKIKTLDGEERTLSSRMLVIADAEKAMAIGGVMGGAESEVDEGTQDIILETAYFNPSAIRWTAKRLNLSSDSSYRFERGVDSSSVASAAQRAIDLILETAGGTVLSPVYKEGAETDEQIEITFSPDYIRERCGFEISDDQISQFLQALELSIASRNDEAKEWTVAIPSFRSDLSRPIDLVEEVLRLYGTDKIPSAVVRFPGIVGKDDPICLFNRRASAYLVGQDFRECMNYTLRSGEEMKQWQTSAQAEGLKLANPITEDQTHLRSSILPGLLDVLKLNRDRKTGITRLFECGRTFSEENGQVNEMISAGFLIAENEDEIWLKRSPADFYLVKSLLFQVARFAGFDLANHPIEAIEKEGSTWQAGHSAAYDNAKAGISYQVGLINLSHLQARGLKGNVYAGHFSILPARLKGEKKRKQYKSFSTFPPALRDLALVVDQAEPAGDVGRKLSRIGKSMLSGRFDLEDINVFDLYKGEGLPAGKKSLAFSLVFRSEDKTLTDEEVNIVFQKIQDEVEAKTDYQIRK